MSDCTKALVNVYEVRVTQSERYGPLYEPGSEAEWRLTFDIGGQPFQYADDHVKNGSVLRIDRDFAIDLASGMNLTVGVSGEEIDDTSANDPIPGASLTLTPSQVRSGPSRRKLHADTIDFIYDVILDIRCDAEGVLDETSKSGPAVALFNGDVYLAWVGDPNLLLNVINLRTMKKITLNETGIGGAALSVLGNRLFIAWTGSDPERHLNIMSSTDGENFENKVTLPHTSFDRPALATFKGRLYLAWVGNDDEKHLNILHSSDGYTNFSVNTKLSDTSFAGPSLLASNSDLRIGWVGRDGEGRINSILSSDGENFENKETLTETSRFAPSLEWYDDTQGTPSQFYVVWTGEDPGSKLNHAHSIFIGSYEGKQTLSDSSIAGPAVLSRPGRLDAFWTGTDGEGHLSYMTIVKN